MANKSNRSSKKPKSKTSSGFHKPPLIDLTHPDQIVLDENIIENSVQSLLDIAASQRNKISAMLAELGRRRMEAIPIYKSLPWQEAFHKSRAKQRTIRGSNRSGKTLAAALEVARAVTAQDPYKKYPLTNGRAYCVAESLGMVGEVMWHKLHNEGGAFQVIRDRKTNEWRPFQIWNKEDLDRQHEAKPNPPLIPDRLIKGISWYKKKDNQPQKVILTTGWEINFFSAEGSPPKGVDLDLVWFTEEILARRWYSEMMARLVDRNGRFIWDATPQVGTAQLFQLHKRATWYKKDGIKNPPIEEFVALLSDNPHLTHEQKEELASNLSDEERDVRIGGNFVFSSFTVYDEYAEDIHLCPRFDIPDDWSRYLAIDPGRQVCAVLFLAVPPDDDPQHGRRKFIYDELYIKKCTAARFGEEFAKRCQGQNFELFIIDGRFARQTESGSGKTIGDQYRAQLEMRNIKCNELGSSFIYGHDDKDSGILHVKSWLDAGSTRPMLQVFDDLKNWRWEIEYYHNKRDEDGNPTDKTQDKKNHLMDCTRYLASHGCPYREPKKLEIVKTPVMMALDRKREKKKQKEGRRYYNFGPRKARAS